MGGPATDKSDAPIGNSIAFVPVKEVSGVWSPAIENDGYVYTGRGGNIKGVQSKEKVWIDLDAIGLTFGPEKIPKQMLRKELTVMISVSNSLGMAFQLLTLAVLELLQIWY